MDMLSIGENRKLRLLKEIEKQIVGKKILDVGCYFGITTDYFSKKGFDVVGIDIEEKCIELCKSRYPKNNFFLRDILDEREKYDTILMIGVLEEMDTSPPEVMKKLRINLNPNGRIIIFVRNTNSLKRRIKSLFGLEPIDTFEMKFWCFTKKRLKDMLLGLNYNIIEETFSRRDSLRKKTFPVPKNFSEDIIMVVEKTSQNKPKTK